MVCKLNFMSKKCHIPINNPYLICDDQLNHENFNQCLIYCCLFGSGFIDDEMYDVKYKEHFLGKLGNGHNHKHWWNKAEPLWITAMNNRVKVKTIWWKGACNITIKGRTPKNCVPYKEKVSNTEVSKQLESIVEQFSENKLDLALLSYEKIDEIGHEFGPESYKLRKAVRHFDKILEDLLKEIDEKKMEDKLNLGNFDLYL